MSKPTKQDSKDDGWTVLKKNSRTYSYPKWYNFLTRRKIRRMYKNMSAGGRVKFDKPISFTEDFTIKTRIKVIKDD